MSAGDVGCGVFECFENNSCEIRGLQEICMTFLHNAGKFDSQVLNLSLSVCLPKKKKKNGITRGNIPFPSHLFTAPASSSMNRFVYLFFSPHTSEHCMYNLESETVRALVS